MITVPKLPEPECIDSMCLRYDHSFWLQKDRETEKEFEYRQNAMRATMRQLYEEATGQGFFNR